MALDAAEEARKDILNRLTEAFAEEGINAAIDESTGRITLDNSILFDYDSYRLSDDGKAYLDRFLRAYARALLDGEHADDVKAVEFDGHTDTDGSHEYNQKLSENRAGAVLEYCTGMFLVASFRMIANTTIAAMHAIIMTAITTPTATFSFLTNVA